MAFSALIKRPEQDGYWTPMYWGSTVTAKEYLENKKHATEVSIFRGGRFVKRIIKEKVDDQKRFSVNR